MLMLFPTVKVPGLDDIEIFRDHEKSDTFYALRGRPKIAIDTDGNPQMSFNFFSRNADIAYASSANKELVETQLGQLLLTVDLSVTEEEHNKITEYLSSLLAKPASRFVRLYGLLAKRPGVMLTPGSNKPVIKLGTPNTWKEGTAKLEILEGLGDTFKKSSSAEVKPSLIGSNSASFYATLGIEGSQIYYDALTQGYSGDGEELTPLQAIVRYDLSGFAFVPNIEAKVWANSTQMYSYMETFSEDYRKENRGYTKTTHSPGKTVRIDARSVTASKYDIASLIEEMIDKKVINIEITDFGDVAANSADIKELESSLRSSLMDTIMSTIIPNFFESAFIGKEEGTAADGTPLKPNPEMGVTDAERTKPTVDTYYSFKNNVDKKQVNELNFSFKKNGTVEFRRFPNATLSTQLTKEQREKLIKHIDVSSPEVQILTVQIGVNADFKTDNIHSIIVNISYSQRDFKSGVVRESTKSFMYKTGEEINTFRVTMARNEKGELIDFYNVVAKISYIGTADSPPEIKLDKISDRSLVISYDKLGFVTVNCIANDIDWTVIREAVVSLEYPHIPGKPDTKKDIRLTQQAPTGNWRCYMYGNSNKTYKYSVRYNHIDGSETQGPEKTDSRDTLMVDDLLTGRVKASFDVILNTDTVKAAKVEVLYEDPAFHIKEEHAHWFKDTETWEWVIRLTEGASQKFKYRYFVEYIDGLLYTSPWTEANSDEDINPINLRRHKKKLTIDGSSLNWTQWAAVLVTITYSEPEKDYFISETVKIDSEQKKYDFNALAFTAAGLPFKYALQFEKAAEGSDSVLVEEKDITSGYLLLKAPQA
ncbi:hypothetical protein [Dyadobacter bucti]|uniref:hypothetical protein n=1 Tax=Dyadobacter bucti TaxID=2572203 RepID=UPI003F708494